METIAIDLGKANSQVCVRDSKGRILQEKRCTTRSLEKYLKRREPGARVIMETCSEAFAVAEFAKQAGHDVRIVPATLCKTLGVGHRGIKTDARDAQVLSEVYVRIEEQMPSVHIPSEQSKERKAT